VELNLKSLIGKLNETCRSSLESAAGLCLSRTNYDVEVEHFLTKIVEAPDTDASRIFRHFGVNTSRLSSDLTRALDQLKTGNAKTPSLSPRIASLVEDAWLAASVDYGVDKVRSGHIILALLSSGDMARLARGISSQFAAISTESLAKHLVDITAGSAEAKALL